MSEKIELEINVPVELAFRYDSGKLCEKRWPGAEDTYARQTDDGRVLFVSADDERRLRGVRAGQKVQLTRCQTKNGSKYLVVKSVAPELKQPLGVHAGGRGFPSEKYAGSPAPAAHEGEPPAAQSLDAPNVMAECLKQAIIAAKHAQEFATSAAFPIVFGPDQIQALASTLYIQAAKQANINLMHRNEQLRNQHAIH